MTHSRRTFRPLRYRSPASVLLPAHCSFPTSAEGVLFSASSRNTVSLTLTRRCAAAIEFCWILERIDIFEFRRSDLANTFPHREAQFARCGQWRQSSLHAFLRGRHRQHFRKERPPASPSQHKRGEKAPFPLLSNGDNNSTDALPMFVIPMLVIPTEITSTTFQKPDRR